MSKKYPSTPVTMIDRLVVGDGSHDWNRAWESFVEIYSPAIRGSIGYEFNRLGWHHLDERMINTVLSDVIVKFLKASGSFKYDPEKGKFRNYLSQIISWCVKDYITASNHNPAEELSEENDKADPTDDDPRNNVDRAWKMATFRTFLEEARARLGSQTMLIFEMTKILEQPVDEVMSQLKVSRSTVDNSNRRVMQLLRELIENSPMKEELR